ncbi:hypothetical protein CW368_10755 [Actinomycetales bacterium SN12]|nr:hypothetical protein CW368_10755 [Actinomycetales bacterium SN12]
MDAVAHRDARIRALAEAAIDRLRTGDAPLRYAAVLTDDGFAVQTVSIESDADDGRFASIASTLQALGEAAGRELLTAGGTATVLIDTSAGRIAQMRVGETSLVLAALFSHAGATDGILNALRACAEALADSIRGSEPTPDITTESNRRAQ